MSLPPSPSPSADEKLILLIKETRDRADWFRLEQSKAAPRPEGKG